MIFVGTSAWFAYFVGWDSHHAAARAWGAANQKHLITADVTLVELFTLLKVRGEYRTAITIGDRMWAGEFARVEPTLESDLKEAWTIYKAYQDKAWSFVDCISLVMMERLGVKQAFAFDDHFRQFGTVTVVP